MKIDKIIGAIIVTIATLALVSILSKEIKSEYKIYMKEYKGTETTQGEEVIVDIPKGASAKKVAAILHKKGLIKYEKAFLRRLKDSDIDTFQPGTYVLNTGMNTLQMMEIMSYVEPGKKVLFTLTIPEGYTIEMIAQRVEEKGICSAQEFIDEVKNGNHQLPFGIVTNSELKYNLQGFLFPATYDIFEDTTAASLVDAMLTKFSDVYTDRYAARAAELGYSDFEVLIMASVIEREAKLSEERPIIAGVINNRLKEGMKLQIDPTVLYPLTDGMYNKDRVLYEDLEIDSHYNTYKYEGLPIGPICNPGDDCITAVLYPEEHNYLYYHTSEAGDGSHVFTETYEEHKESQ